MVENSWQNMWPREQWEIIADKAGEAAYKYTDSPATGMVIKQLILEAVGATPEAGKPRLAPCTCGCTEGRA